MSIQVVVKKGDVVISSGAQYNYTEAKLYQSQEVYVSFNRSPLDKQSSQYAYTNENPVSIEAQSISTPGLMLMSGSRNNVETKIFIGPRDRNYTSLEIKDVENDVTATFSGNEFEALLNTDRSKYISIIYTQSSNGSSYELDLHTDLTSYDYAVNHSNLDYLGTHNYPHFNQIKYSSRIVSADDFISDSMSIRNTIKYEPHFGNYYIRPDFVKAFKGFKILGCKSASISLTGPSTINIDSDQVSYSYIAQLTNEYYDYVKWSYEPKIPGFRLVPSSDTHSATLYVDRNQVKSHDLYTSKFKVNVSCRGCGVANSEANLIYSDTPSANSYDIYIPNPTNDPNPWYDILDYVELDLPYRYRADSYELTQTGSDFKIDNSNHRFKFIGTYPDQVGTLGTLTFKFTPAGSETSVDSTITVYSIDTPLELDGTELSSKIKVHKWTECDESNVYITNRLNYSCTLNSVAGLISIKAITDHGIYLYRRGADENV